MKYLTVSRKQKHITLELTTEATDKPLEAIISWAVCILSVYEQEKFIATLNLGQLGLKNEDEMHVAFTRQCDSLSPIARTLHASLLHAAKQPTFNFDHALDMFTEFYHHQAELSTLKEKGKLPRYSVKKHTSGHGVILTLREDAIALLGPQSARLCVSALSKTVERERGGPVYLYNPHTAFATGQAPEYSSFSFWLMARAFTQYLTDLPWSIAQVKELAPQAIALSEFFERQAH